MAPHISNNKKAGGHMTKLIKKTILATPIAVIATFGFAATAFAASSISNDRAFDHQDSRIIINTSVNDAPYDYGYTANTAYKTVNYNYKPRRSYYKSKRRHNSYKPYYKSKPYYKPKSSYYGKTYKHGHKFGHHPRHRSKFKSFGHKKSFRKGHKSRFHYKY